MRPGLNIGNFNLVNLALTGLKLPKKSCQSYCTCDSWIKAIPFLHNFIKSLVPADFMISVEVRQSVRKSLPNALTTLHSGRNKETILTSPKQRLPKPHSRKIGKLTMLSI